MWTYVKVDETDELKHYGVLGMKWGQHRARVNQSKAAKQRKAASELRTAANRKDLNDRTRKALNDAVTISNNRAKAYSDKAKAIEQKHIDRTDKKTYDRVAKTSTGKALAQSYLMGTYGALKYNEARSHGKDRGESFVSGLGSAAVNSATGGIYSISKPRSNARKKRAQRSR